MARRKSSTAEADAPETEQASGTAVAEGSLPLTDENGNPVGGPNDGAAAEVDQEEIDEAFHTPRESGDVQQCVEAAAQTIDGVGDNEKKNFFATMDFICRNGSVLMADMWPGICKTARNGKDDGGKVSVTLKIDMNLTNPLLMDTKLKLSYSEKHSKSTETHEDLSQTEFNLNG